MCRQHDSTHPNELLVLNCVENVWPRKMNVTASAAAEQLADRNQVVEGIELPKQNDLVNATSARSRTT